MVPESELSLGRGEERSVEGPKPYTPFLLSSGQEIPGFSPKEWIVLHQILKAPNKGSVSVWELAKAVANFEGIEKKTARTEVTNQILSPLRRKLSKSEIGKILTSGRQLVSYSWSPSEGINTLELAWLAEKVVKGLPERGLWTLRDIIEEAAQRKGWLLDSSLYSYLANKVSRIRKELGIDGVWKKGRTFVYKKEDAQEILAQISLIEKRKRKKAGETSVEEKKNWAVELFPSPSKLQETKIGVTNCLLSHLVSRGGLKGLSKAQGVDEDPRVILKSYLDPEANSKLDSLEKQELRQLGEFFVYHLLIVTLEEFWPLVGENFAPFLSEGKMASLVKNLREVQRKFSKEEVIRKICEHFSVEVPERYLEKIVDKVI